MPTLPKHILTAIENGKTSLGKHPSFSSENDENPLLYLMQSTFDELCEKIDDIDYNTMKDELGKILGSCKKLEQNNRQALEQLCARIVNDIFQIPQDTVDIEMNLVDTVDTSDERLLPEKSVDFPFEDINDISNTTKEIYKRRMLNVLVTGAAMYYMNNVIKYVNEIFNINSDLPSLYKKMIDYNNILMFCEKEHLDDKNSTCGGKVDVIITTNDGCPTIKADGVLFPLLLEETIKGLLELAIAHGLPQDLEKAKYIMGKSDFKLAEMWDMRIGFCLWKLIESEMNDIGKDMLEVGINFFLMQLATMDCDTFNKSLQEIFAKTRKGKEILSDIVDEILYEKDKDEFDDYIQTKNDSTFQINDDDYFSAEELLVDDDNDDYFTPEELISDSLQIDESIKKNLSESEWNYHFNGKSNSEHDMKPYGSDSKYVMPGRETGHFGSGTYFSTYKDLNMDSTYNSNPNPNFIKVGDGTYRVDFDLYKNLYRVRSKKQGDILYTLCYNLNRMYARMTNFGKFNKNTANYNNSDLYQVIKANADALNLKCPSYYELIRMAQNHTGDQSFSTLFMEYNGYNGVNVSGVEYYDNTKHGSVIYDLSKINTEMEEVKPKSLFTGFKDTPYNDTIAQQDFIDKPEIEALKGGYITWYYKINEMPMSQALRVLKNYTMSGNMLNPYSMRDMDDNLKNRYLKMLYAAVTKGWPNSHYLYDTIMWDDNKKPLLNLIEKTKAYYWVNCGNNKDSMLIELLLNKRFDWDLSIDEENKQRKEYLDILLGYLNRDLTIKEKSFIENDYYNTEEEY